MATIPYNLSVPNPNGPPKNDAAPMQENTNGNSLIWQEDHYTFNQNSKDGQHAVIRQPIRNPDNDPAAISSPATGQTYTKTANGTLQLFYETPSGVISQLTGPVQPNPSATATGNESCGFSILPGGANTGGIKIQWGRSNAVGSSLDVFFPSAFSNPPTSVTVTGNSNNRFFRVISVSTTKFTVTPDSSSSSGQVYWIAIGQ